MVSPWGYGLSFTAKPLDSFYYVAYIYVHSYYSIFEHVLSVVDLLLPVTRSGVGFMMHRVD